MADRRLKIKLVILQECQSRIRLTRTLRGIYPPIITACMTHHNAIITTKPISLWT
ncbi:MAG: hypothetical protein P8O22_09765 [Akkermansiaceae bacterium]|nr:hypothetical protein [Akkermansiaceae bacterium]